MPDTYGDPIGTDFTKILTNNFMEHKTVALPEFKVAGIAIHTSNESMAEIGALWGRFYKEGIQGKIPNKTDGSVIGLYTEYEGDHTKPYTLLIGCKVSKAENLPEGFSTKTIPAAKYAVFTAKGKMPDCIMEAWQGIWNSDIERAYTSDFELYGEKSADPANAEIDIYIAIKD